MSNQYSSHSSPAYCEEQLQALWVCLQEQANHNNRTEKRLQGLEDLEVALRRIEEATEQKLKEFDQRLDRMEEYGRRRIAAFHKDIAAHSDNIKQLYTFLNEVKVSRSVKFGSALSTPHRPSFRRTVKSQGKATDHDYDLSPTPQRASPFHSFNANMKKLEMSPNPLRSRKALRLREGTDLPLQPGPGKLVRLKGESLLTTPTTPSASVKSSGTPAQKNAEFLVEQGSPGHGTDSLDTQSRTPSKLLRSTRPSDEPNALDPDFDDNSTVAGKSLAVEMGINETGFFSPSENNEYATALEEGLQSVSESMIDDNEVSMKGSEEALLDDDGEVKDGDNDLNWEDVQIRRQRPMDDAHLADGDYSKNNQQPTSQDCDDTSANGAIIVRVKNSQGLAIGCSQPRGSDERIDVSLVDTAGRHADVIDGPVAPDGAITQGKDVERGKTSEGRAVDYFKPQVSDEHGDVTLVDPADHHTTAIDDPVALSSPKKDPIVLADVLFEKTTNPSKPLFDDGHEACEVKEMVEDDGLSGQGPKKKALKARPVLTWANVRKSLPLGVVLVIIVVTATILSIGFGLGLAVCVACRNNRSTAHPTASHSSKLGKIKFFG